jgi:hypothetical protein
MTRVANPMRGEAAISIAGCEYLLRPTFEALVAAEVELGSLFAMVERASQGSLGLAEMSALIWYCLPAANRPDRAAVGEAVLAMGLIEAARPMRIILAQVLKGLG